MKKTFLDRIHKLLEEEQRYDVDIELLDKLREFAAEDSIIPNFPASVRNSFNAFFQEVKGMVFNELMSGNYGADVVVDTAIVLAFEVGYKAAGQPLRVF